MNRAIHETPESLQFLSWVDIQQVTNEVTQVQYQVPPSIMFRYKSEMLFLNSSTYIFFFFFNLAILFFYSLVRGKHPLTWLSSGSNCLAVLRLFPLARSTSFTFTHQPLLEFIYLFFLNSMCSS